MVKVLPDGRVRIHYLVPDPAGPAKTPGGAVAAVRGGVPRVLRHGGVTGHVACQPSRTNVTPDAQGGFTVPFAHTTDPRAATCPECLATAEAKKALAELGEPVEPEQES